MYMYIIAFIIIWLIVVSIFLSDYKVTFMFSDSSPSPFQSLDGNPLSGSQGQGPISDFTTSPTQAPGGGDCLTLLNQFRQSKGLAPLVAASATQQTCANSSAVNDAARGYHNSYGKCGERAQCECSKGVGGGGIAGCINAYIGEGPSGGHYNIISGNYKSVACGTDGNGFFTHNFYA